MSLTSRGQSIEVNDDIRFIIINRNDAVKELFLTQHQLSMMRLIKRGYNTSSKLKKATGRTVQGVSQTLISLYHKGYLSRVESIQESGGVEYIYSIRVAL